MTTRCRAVKGELFLEMVLATFDGGTLTYFVFQSMNLFIRLMIKPKTY